MVLWPVMDKLPRDSLMSCTWQWEIVAKVVSGFRLTTPKFRLFRVTKWAPVMVMSYEGRVLPGTFGSPWMVRLSRLTKTVAPSGVAFGSMVTVPPVPAAGSAADREGKWGASRGRESGTTNTLASISVRSSRTSIPGRNDRTLRMVAGRVGLPGRFHKRENHEKDMGLLLSQRVGLRDR